MVDVSEKEALEFAIIENVQRSDLNALEEALGYQQLMAEFDYSQQDLGRVIGKSRSHVANTLRLTKLPDSVQGMVIDGRISAGHARALLSVSDPKRIAHRIIDEGLSVRDVERIVQKETKPELQSEEKDTPRKVKDSDTLALEHKGERGEMRIRYRNLEQLDHLCQRLKR